MRQVQKGAIHARDPHGPCHLDRDLPDDESVVGDLVRHVELRLLCGEFVADHHDLVSPDAADSEAGLLRERGQRDAKRKGER
ncbi:MAG: hypothetical protein NTU45_11895 [Planctomycetota bacterium]|nr:hypothetical protein [Planctomycetota bacterium]